MALGVLHQLMKPVPGRFKDYIAIPKANGYQSLHTTLVSPLGTAVEFQIRTEPMHAVAEKGIAAHWLYKEHDDGPGHGSEAQRLGALWLQSLIDIQDETRDAGEFLEHVKIDLYPDAVYVFTPRSKILALPRGATPVDFAYAIHTDVGDHCVAANVNGEPVPLRAELKSGDVVEIIGAANARPNPAWLNFVCTGRARSKIRHYLKNMEHEESRGLGEKMLAQSLRAEGLSMPPEDGIGAPIWQQLLRWSGNKSRDDLFVDIGVGRKIATIVATRLARLLAEGGIRADALTLTMGRYAVDDSAPSQGLVLIDGSEGASVQLALVLPADPGRRHRRQPRPRRGPVGAHRRVQRRQAPARARQRALDARRLGRAADAVVRDRGLAAGQERQGRAGAGRVGSEPCRSRHHPHRHGPGAGERDDRAEAPAQRARPAPPRRGDADAQALVGGAAGGARQALTRAAPVGASGTGAG